MGNCLVTKLKGSVNKDLSKLGTITLHSYVPESGRGLGNRTLILGGQGVELSTEGTGYSFYIPSVGSQHMTNFVLSNQEYYEIVFDEGDYDVEVRNKYALTFFGTTETYPGNILPKNIDEFAYTNLTYFTIHSNIENAIGGDCSVFKDFGSNITRFVWLGKEQPRITGVNTSNLGNLSPELTHFNLPGLTLRGDISVLSRYNKCVVITSQGDSGLTGNIEVLGSNTNLRNIFADIYYPSTSIRGSIDAFVEAQCNAETPRTSFQFPGIMNQILNVCTFNGTIQGGHGWGWLGWESASKIYVLNGANNAAGCPYVTCKGYTQAEAEAKWPGKTIIRVDA